MGKILVTGGAGYIGSHIVRMLQDAGREVVVLDNFCEGHRAAIGATECIAGNFGDARLLDEHLSGGRIDFIVHMAAFCEVGESVAKPEKYYRNNVARSLTLLDRARRHGVRGIVFSSTCAVYGEPERLPLSEDHPFRPTNPYGETKLAFERALAAYHVAYDMRYVALRYFNAAGAHPDGSIGEDHSPESHLIPRLLRAARDGAEPMPIFGNDYPTPDGTCVRDYIHVNDLARAHILALEALDAQQLEADCFNLGIGEGFSVQQVVDRVEALTGRRPPTKIAPRRPGDPATLIATSEKIRSTLGWEASFRSLDAILETAWRWHQSHPEGYGERKGD